MGGFVDLGALLAAAVAAGAAPGRGELTVVETEISDVLTTLRAEQKVLEKVDFKAAAFIPGSSFGGGPKGPMLALHHTRAHGVVTDTLAEMIADLETLQTAIVGAKALVGEADADAQAKLATLLARADDLDLGQDSHAQAQVDHRDDVVTDQRPEAVPGTDSVGLDDVLGHPDSPGSPPAELVPGSLEDLLGGSSSPPTDGEG